MAGVRFWMVVIFASTLVLSGACTPAATPSSTPLPSTAPVSGEQPEPEPGTSENSEAGISQEKSNTSANSGEPTLSSTLARDCESGRQAGGGFQTVGLAEGEKAINFTLKDTYGNEFTLSRLLAEKPVVMVFGSFTWPPFRQRCAANDDLYAKYGEQVHFIIIYIVEAHSSDSSWPSAYSTDQEGNPIYQPLTYEARLELARKTVAEEGISVPVLVDEIDNPLSCTYGPAPNIAYFIATDGTIVEKQGWYQPQQMEETIADYLTRDGN